MRYTDEELKAIRQRYRDLNISISIQNKRAKAIQQLLIEGKIPPEYQETRTLNDIENDNFLKLNELQTLTTKIAKGTKLIPNEVQTLLDDNNMVIDFIKNFPRIERELKNYKYLSPQVVLDVTTQIVNEQLKNLNYDPDENKSKSYVQQSAPINQSGPLEVLLKDIVESLNKIKVDVDQAQLTKVNDMIQKYDAIEQSVKIVTDKLGFLNGIFNMNISEIKQLFQDNNTALQSYLGSAEGVQDMQGVADAIRDLYNAVKGVTPQVIQQQVNNNISSSIIDPDVESKQQDPYDTSQYNSSIVINVAHINGSEQYSPLDFFIMSKDNGISNNDIFNIFDDNNFRDMELAEIYSDAINQHINNFKNSKIILKDAKDFLTQYLRFNDSYTSKKVITLFDEAKDKSISRMVNKYLDFLYNKNKYLRQQEEDNEVLKKVKKSERKQQEEYEKQQEKFRQAEEQGKIKGTKNQALKDLGKVTLKNITPPVQPSPIQPPIKGPSPIQPPIKGPSPIQSPIKGPSPQNIPKSITLKMPPPIQNPQTEYERLLNEYVMAQRQIDPNNDYFRNENLANIDRDIKAYLHNTIDEELKRVIKSIDDRDDIDPNRKKVLVNNETEKRNNEYKDNMNYWLKSIIYDLQNPKQTPAKTPAYTYTSPIIPNLPPVERRSPAPKYSPITAPPQNQNNTFTPIQPAKSTSSSPIQTPTPLKAISPSQSPIKSASSSPQNIPKGPSPRQSPQSMLYIFKNIPDKNAIQNMNITGNTYFEKLLNLQESVYTQNAATISQNPENYPLVAFSFVTLYDNYNNQIQVDPVDVQTLTDVSNQFKIEYNEYSQKNYDKQSKEETNFRTYFKSQLASIENIIKKYNPNNTSDLISNKWPPNMPYAVRFDQFNEYLDGLKFKKYLNYDYVADLEKLTQEQFDQTVYDNYYQLSTDQLNRIKGGQSSLSTNINP